MRQRQPEDDSLDGRWFVRRVAAIAAADCGHSPDDAAGRTQDQTEIVVTSVEDATEQ